MFTHPSTIAAILTSVAILVSGCGAVPVDEPRYYLLSSPQPGTSEPVRYADLCDATVAGVTVPAYLQRNNVMVQVSEHELVPAAQHRWSEPVASGVRRILTQNAVTGDGPAALNVAIEHFHGSLAGTVWLQASWHLTAPDGTVQRSAFNDTVNQVDDGYDAMVAAHYTLLAGLSATIRANCQAEPAG